MLCICESFMCQMGVEIQLQREIIPILFSDQGIIVYYMFHEFNLFIKQ